MKINEAIEKAIEGGYEVELTTVAEKAQGHPHNIEKIFLDPAFWQCLGKAMGWVDKDYPNGEMRCDILVRGEKRCDDRYCSYAGYKDPVAEWHSLIDSLASGGSVEEWFGKLK